MSKKTCKRISGDAATSGEEVVQRAAIRKTVKALVEEDPYRSFDEYIDDAADMLSPDKSKKSLAAMRNTVIEAMARKESSINDPSEAQKRLKLVKKQADLIKKIEGIIDDEKKALPKKRGKKLTNDDIEKLQKVLNDMRDGVRELYADQNTLQKTLDEIDNLKHLLSEGKITKRGKKPGVGSEELNEAKGRLAVLRKNMNFKKNIKHLEDQVSGKVPIEVPTRRPYASEYKMSEVEKQYERENFELDKEIAELKRRADAIAKKQVWDDLGYVGKAERAALLTLREVINVGKGVILSGDLASGINRQFGFFQHPMFWGSRVKAVKMGVLKSLSENAAHVTWKEFQKTRGFIDAVQHGLEMNSPVDKVMLGEEQYQSWIIEKLGKYIGLKQFADLSQRTYRAVLNSLVLDAYNHMTKGITDPAVKKEIAGWINAKVGRGAWAKKVQRALGAKDGAGVLDLLLLTPRYTISGLEAAALDAKYMSSYVTGSVLRGQSKDVRKRGFRIASSWAWYIGTVMFINRLLALSEGWEEDDDPESNTYMTMWKGDDNLNLWGANYQPVKLIGRMTYGIVQRQNDEKTGIAMYDDEFWNYFKFRASVPAQLLKAHLTEEYWGEPFPRFSETASLTYGADADWKAVWDNTLVYANKLSPIPVQNAIKAYKRDGLDVTLAAIILAEQFGINYSIDRDRK